MTLATESHSEWLAKLESVPKFAWPKTVDILFSLQAFPKLGASNSLDIT